MGMFGHGRVLLVKALLAQHLVFVPVILIVLLVAHEVGRIARLVRVLHDMTRSLSRCYGE
jgi:hypothetical protein